MSFFLARDDENERCKNESTRQKEIRALFMYYVSEIPTEKCKKGDKERDEVKSARVILRCVC